MKTKKLKQCYRDLCKIENQIIEAKKVILLEQLLQLEKKVKVAPIISVEERFEHNALRIRGRKW